MMTSTKKTSQIIESKIQKMNGLVNYAEDFEKIGKVGSGTYAKAVLVENRATGKRSVAKFITADCNSNFSARIEFYRDNCILKNCRHPAIVEHEGFSFYDFKNKFKPSVLLDYKINGSLEDVLHPARTTSLNSTQKMIILYGIASGMSYLHSMHVIHRDLKPGNVLLDEDFHPFISDFGCSKVWAQGHTMSQSFSAGTPIFMAPEQLTSRKFGYKVDVYSFGLLAFNLITGHLPTYMNNCTSRCKLIEMVREGVRPGLYELDVPEDFKNLFQRCFNFEPSLRPEFKEIMDFLRHNFLYETDCEEYFRYVGLATTKVAKPIIVEEIRMSSDETFSRGMELYDLHEYDEALPYFMKLSNENNFLASALAANCIVESRNPNKDLEAAFHLYEISSEHDVGEGFYGLSLCYKNGFHVHVNRDQMFNFAVISDSLGSSNGQWLLSLIFAEGIGATRDLNQALYYSEMSALQKNARGQMLFEAISRKMKPKIYEPSIDVLPKNVKNEEFEEGMSLYKEKRFKEARFHFEKSFDCHNYDSLAFAGHCIVEDFEYPKDFETAFKYYSAASDKKNGEGLYGLSRCYLYGWYVDMDLMKAITLSKESADTGNSNGQWFFYHCCQRDTHLRFNKSESTKYAFLSAESGNPEGLAYKGLIVIFSDDNPNHNERNKKIFDESVEGESGIGKYFVGLWHTLEPWHRNNALKEFSNEYDYDSKKGLKLLIESARDGFADSYCRIALTGLVANHGSLEYFCLLAFSAFSGSTFGIYQFSCLILSQYGKDKSSIQDTIWLFRKSAENGFLDAIGDLFLLYYYGIARREDLYDTISLIKKSDGLFTSKFPYLLIFILITFRGNRSDLDKAEELFEKCENQSDIYGEIKEYLGNLLKLARKNYKMPVDTWIDIDEPYKIEDHMMYNIFGHNFLVITSKISNNHLWRDLAQI